jgi:leukotriene-A4 hydrolase
MEDPSSNANIQKAVINHISLKWKVDFDKKSIAGSARLTIKAISDTDVIILDGKSLDIKSICADEGKELKYSIEAAQVHELGEKIVIHTGPLKAGDQISLVISYSVGETASAIQFIDKELTADKKKAFLYSQCQAIHARSIIPCMDTPAVKQTYDAEVEVPADMVCLLSALSDGSNPSVTGGTVFKFRQPIKIPIYLFAIVVGAMAKRDISERCAVWAEESLVERAQWEFEETEKMLQTAETLLGKYMWGRYDLVVLPPTFPYGGMENPCLTFVTPTLIAGDRSLTYVIAHEIAHSWTGNLVTNANWEHFCVLPSLDTLLTRHL